MQCCRAAPEAGANRSCRAPPTISMLAGGLRRTKKTAGTPSRFSFVLNGFARAFRCAPCAESVGYSRSMIVAVPMPPPQHITS